MSASGERRVRVLRPLLGVLLGLVARVWLATLRVRVRVAPELDACADRPWILSLFHGTQWPLLALRRRRPTVVLVSHSADGEMQARALGMLGFAVVRGSSSRGGARGLASLLRRVRRGADAAFAVDGPRGPRGVPKPGAAVAARSSGGVLVPLGAAVSRGKVFTRAWDRFVLAWPFAEVAVVYGAPVPMTAMSGGDGIALARAIEAANAEAAGMLLDRGAKVISLHEVLGAAGVGEGGPAR